MQKLPSYCWILRLHRAVDACRVLADQNLDVQILTRFIEQVEGVLQSCASTQQLAVALKNDPN
jgi:hypothetical protein